MKREPMILIDLDMNGATFASFGVERVTISRDTWNQMGHPEAVMITVAPEGDR